LRNGSDESGLVRGLGRGGAERGVALLGSRGVISLFCDLLGAVEVLPCFFVEEAI